MKLAEEIQRKLQSEMEIYKNLQKEIQKYIGMRQQLDGQLNENGIVKAELGVLPADNKVYKCIGVVLIRTDVEEAKQNVNKRIEYITGEIERIDKLIGDVKQRQDSYRDSIQKLQQQFQQAQIKAAMHS